jgi:hypothetical protein
MYKDFEDYQKYREYLNVKFMTDNERGIKGEDLIADFLMSKNPGSKIIFNRGGDLEELRKKDFILVKKSGEEVKIEVKTDLWDYYKKRDNKNIFIEVMYNKKLSGVHTSNADYLIYFFPERGCFYMIKRLELLKKLGNPELFKRRGDCGDGGKSIGYLYNIENEAGIFRVYNLEYDKNIFNIKGEGCYE